jgi:hypothetical protein
VIGLPAARSLNKSRATKAKEGRPHPQVRPSLVQNGSTASGLFLRIAALHFRLGGLTMLQNGFPLGVNRAPNSKFTFLNPGARQKFCEVRFCF